MEFMKPSMKYLPVLLAAVAGACCQNHQENDMSNITENTITAIVSQSDVSDRNLFEKGVRQAAFLWRETDGTGQDFTEFVKAHYAATPEARKVLFDHLSRAFEIFSGSANQLTVDLQKPTVLSGDDPIDVDYIFGGYSATAHFSDDMFENGIAFTTVLNFPSYTLAEKNELGTGWSRLEWAYARMGDMFTTRIPAAVLQRSAAQNSATENYIADYNIMMGHLLTEDGRRLFPEDMVLLSHWNLRDEIKSNYADVPDANEKQEMIYKVMERIACQDIPAAVVNNPSYDWAPYSNKTWKDGEEVELTPEGTERYAQILRTYRCALELDPYSPGQPTGIIRNFEGSMEVTADEIEELFIHLISSEQVRKTAGLIESRLGRPLRPYDIWYDGFKSRSAMPEDALTAQTRRLYPTPAAFEADMPRMLRNLGFPADYADFVSDKIGVDAARGSGHAWPAAGRGYKSFLRTRAGEFGMDYKGYNIATHEFGHNVEETIDLYDIDYYPLAGVPNTAFTEALAFVFQKRDLQLLGYESKFDDNTTLDIFWGMYEIMGVSLVDMYTWRWLYEHPEATAESLRDNCLRIAREVWNRYYEPVLGTPDSPILAIYSHMVNSPMYLPNYPFGHIIEYQLEEYFSKLPDPRCIGPEITRIYRLGRLTPQIWMQQAVGSRVTTEPILKAVDRIIK